MKTLDYYLHNFMFYPFQIVLHKIKRGIYYQGKIKDIPQIYRSYYVLEHTNLNKLSKVEFTIIEGI